MPNCDFVSEDNETALARQTPIFTMPDKVAVPEMRAGAADVCSLSIGGRVRGFQLLLWVPTFVGVPAGFLATAPATHL